MNQINRMSGWQSFTSAGRCHQRGSCSLSRYEQRSFSAPVHLLAESILAPLRFVRGFRLAALSLLLLTPSVVANDALFSGFKSPPDSARVQTWWHWMNGHINQDEALNDLRWLKEIGIGGVQVFEAGLGPPAPDSCRIEFGSTPWRAALRASAAEARDLGMNFAITTSPGWSATGGPWVAPQDAMQKLVWSELRVQGGKTVNVQLPSPPSVPGPYQDIPVGYGPGHVDEEGISSADGKQKADYYRDIAVLAVADRSAKLPNFSLTSSQPLVAAQSLTDGKFWPAQQLAADSSGTAWIAMHFEEVVQLSSITIGNPDARGFGTPQPPRIHVEYSMDGELYHPLVELHATKSPVRSGTFSATPLKHIRVVFSADPQPGFMEQLHYVDGANRLPFATRHTHYAVSEISLYTEPRVHAHSEKAGFAAAPDYYRLDTQSSVSAPAARSVLDLTAALQADGALVWEAPAGEWRLIRIGAALTGQENGPAPENATGLEVDKLSAEKVTDYLDAYLKNYSSPSGRLFAGINGLLSDSIESGAQNWTPGLLQKFVEVYGYDPTPYLPVLTGLVIGSAKASDQFLWDYRALLAQLVTDEHYAAVANVAKQHGLTYYAEALEDHRPQLGNDLDMRSGADIPMAAFWFYPEGAEPKPTYLMDVKGAASVANLNGSKIVAAEALTTFGHPWAVGPKELKRVADRAFAQGVNRLIMHSSVHQSDGLNQTPGRSMMPLLGHYFNRNVGWAEMAKPWLDYLRRSQFLLQQGTAQAQIAYFIGEEAPVTGLYGDSLPSDIPQGYSYDFVSAQGLNQLLVQGKHLVNRSGNRYQLLHLGGASERMTLRTIRVLTKLAKQGVTIAGVLPKESPSLADDAQAWLKARSELAAQENVLQTKLSAGLERLSIAPQWRFKALSPATATEHQSDKKKIGSITAQNDSLAHGVRVLKRSSETADIFFVVNTTDKALQGELELDSQGIPQWWNAVSASRHSMTDWRSAAERSIIPLSLQPYEAGFLVLHKDQSVADQSGETNSCASLPLNLPQDGSQRRVLDNEWTLSFSASGSEMPLLTQTELTSLHKHADHRVRHFSGTTVYKTDFDYPALDDPALSKSATAAPLCLRVGNVGDIAAVKLNSEVAGHLWSAPYELDISSLVREGSNTLEIRVANYWANALIGMAAEGSARAGFPGGVYQATAPLRPAGLIGPVELLRRADSP